MARRDKDDDEEKGVSLHPDKAVAGGGAGLGPGPAIIESIGFDKFEYKKKGQTKGVTAVVLLVGFDRDGEKEKVPYGVGNGWRVGKGGKSLVALNGQEGLPDNCNAFYFLDSLKDAGMPDDIFDDLKQLVDVEVILALKPIERDFGADKGGIKKKSILVVKEVTVAPWVDDDEKRTVGKRGSAAASGKKKKADDDDDDDDDADEPPKKSSRRGRDADDDDDEKPAKKAAKKGADKDDDAQDVDEEAAEALIDLLGEKSPRKVDDIENAIRAALKGNPQKNAIAARAADDDFLETEKGWSFNAKKGLVELD